MKLLSTIKLNKLMESLEEKYLDLTVENKFCPLDFALSKIKEYDLKIVETSTFEYNNKELIMDEPEILIHNLNHFRVAAPSRRLSLEFGLGNPPNDMFYDKEGELDSELPDSLVQLEEDTVLAYDRIHAIHYGYKLSILTVRSDSRFRNALQNLYLMNMIDEQGKVIDQSLREESFSLREISNW